MSGPSVKFSVDGTTNVDEVTGKVKKSVSSLESQVESIGKKFQTSFKDIFLGFAAPMVIINSLMSMISDGIAKAKQEAKEGLDLIARGESSFSNSEESRAAAYFKRKKELEDEKNLVEAGRSEIAKQVLSNEGGKFSDFQLPQKYVQALSQGSVTMGDLSNNKEVQKIAIEYFNKTDAGRKLTDSLAATAGSINNSTFKSPEGFSNVIGVGSNPVMEAMTAQLEEQKKQTALLEQLAKGSPGTDFTKTK